MCTWPHFREAETEAQKVWRETQDCQHPPQAPIQTPSTASGKSPPPHHSRKAPLSPPGESSLATVTRGAVRWS